MYNVQLFFTWFSVFSRELFTLLRLSHQFYAPAVFKKAAGAFMFFNLP